MLSSLKHATVNKLSSSTWTQREMSLIALPTTTALNNAAKKSGNLERLSCMQRLKDQEFFVRLMNSFPQLMVNGQAC